MKKSILVALAVLFCGVTFGFATETKLDMTPTQWAAYKEARDAKNWAKAEELTVFPDVKAWDAQNQGQEKFVAEDYSGAKADFTRALGYADEADKVGRSEGLTNSDGVNLRDMVKKALDSIAKNEADSDEEDATSK
jgi:hypothetical protein